MTWYYADWSWVHTFTTIATLIMGGVFLVCALVHLARPHLTARHGGVLVPIDHDLRHAPHHQNGSRAA